MQCRVRDEGRTGHTSPLTAPEEKRFVWIGLKSSPRIGPVCVLLRRINDSVGL
jgi:hypothetical protein